MSKNRWRCGQHLSEINKTHRKNVMPRDKKFYQQQIENQKIRKEIHSMRLGVNYTMVIHRFKIGKNHNDDPKKKSNKAHNISLSNNSTRHSNIPIQKTCLKRIQHLPLKFHFHYVSPLSDHKKLMRKKRRNFKKNKKKRLKKRQERLQRIREKELKKS
ncbi:309_t:CDS:2 [Rhizophagus irregularis]|nr:309_t:CDS:2 [Rhizophagus irregularis]